MDGTCLKSANNLGKVPIENGKATNDNEGFKSDVANQTAPYGSSPSLAMIRSLVSMSTPTDGFQMGMTGNPPFIEFDLSIDGFGYLFLPRVFPQEIQQWVTAGGPMSAVTMTTRIGGEDRPFPPSNGLTFSSWILISK